MSFVIQNMDDFDSVFTEPVIVVTTPVEEVDNPLPVSNYTVGPDNPTEPLHIKWPIEEQAVQGMLALLGKTLDTFDPALHPEVETKELKKLGLHEAWDWECALVTSKSLKIAVLAVLDRRHKKGLHVPGLNDSKG